MNLNLSFLVNVTLFVLDCFVRDPNNPRTVFSIVSFGQKVMQRLQFSEFANEWNVYYNYYFYTKSVCSSRLSCIEMNVFISNPELWCSNVTESHFIIRPRTIEWHWSVEAVHHDDPIVNARPRKNRCSKGYVDNILHCNVCYLGWKTQIRCYMTFCVWLS